MDLSIDSGNWNSKSNSPTSAKPPPKWRPSQADKQLKPFYKKSRSERATEAFLSSIGGTDFGSTGIEASSKAAGEVEAAKAGQSGAGRRMSNTQIISDGTAAGSSGNFISSLLDFQAAGPGGGNGVCSSSADPAMRSLVSFNESTSILGGNMSSMTPQHGSRTGTVAPGGDVLAASTLERSVGAGGGGFRKRPLRPWKRMTTGERRETKYLQSLAGLGTHGDGADADGEGDGDEYVVPPMSELTHGARSFYETQLKQRGTGSGGSRREGESADLTLDIGSPTGDGAFTATTADSGQGGMKATELFELFDEKLKREWEKNQAARDQGRKRPKHGIVGDAHSKVANGTRKMGLQVQPEHLDALIPEESGKTVRLRYYASNMRNQQDQHYGGSHGMPDWSTTPDTVPSSILPQQPGSMDSSQNMTRHSSALFPGDPSTAFPGGSYRAGGVQSEPQFSSATQFSPGGTTVLKKKKKRGEVKLLPLASRQHQLVMISSILTNFETNTGQIAGAKARGGEHEADEDNLDIEDGEGGTKIDAEDGLQRGIFEKMYVSGAAYSRRKKAALKQRLSQLFSMGGEEEDEEQEAYYERFVEPNYSAEELRDISHDAGLNIQEKADKKARLIAERKEKRQQEKLAKKREKLERKAAEKALQHSPSRRGQFQTKSGRLSPPVAGHGNRSPSNKKLSAKQPTSNRRSSVASANTSPSLRSLKRTDHGPHHSHHLKDEQPPVLALDDCLILQGPQSPGNESLSGLGSAAVSEATDLHSSFATTSSSSSSSEDSDEYHSSDDSDELQCDEDAYFLDDPTIKGEHRRKLISLPGYRCSIIPFSQVQHLEEDINNRFWLTHPYLQPLGVKLTHLRKIKSMLMLSVALDKQSIIDLSTVIFAICYFEKLVLKLLINENNRHVIASVCLLIAVKFWEGGISNQEIMAKKISWSMDKVHEIWGVSRKKVLDMELRTYVALDFSLLIPPRFALTHFVRQLETCNLTPSEYMSKIEVLKL